MLDLLITGSRPLPAPVRLSLLINRKINALDQEKAFFKLAIGSPPPPLPLFSPLPLPSLTVMEWEGRQDSRRQPATTATDRPSPLSLSLGSSYQHLGASGSCRFSRVAHYHNTFPFAASEQEGK